MTSRRCAHIGMRTLTSSSCPLPMHCFLLSVMCCSVCVRVCVCVRRAHFLSVCVSHFLCIHPLTPAFWETHARYPLLSLPALMGLEFTPDGIKVRLTTTLGRFNFDTPLASMHFDGNQTWRGAYHAHTTGRWFLHVDASQIPKNCRSVSTTTTTAHTMPINASAAHRNANPVHHAHVGHHSTDMGVVSVPHPEIASSFSFRVVCA